ncbi:hypothetical protein KDW19_26385 [Burkholderia cenocepacia]|uniref:hypothetical protein n=1 Tax=Burkholderia cepacia complex TaxID=87882 RepID=UPI000F561542|nr:MULTISPECIES: hypothetical protein [Burkholderia cepacia complex]ELW9449868.1 hypothetical protein [Burkholderia cenocepacia]MBR8079540.1 hypothetical protein [Burkholderia cenocepacia]MBR8485991.1 hypothetical protein [Burkholderia cenocepacia]MDN7471509.1 hypothetical protein [Burkholderia orbicola]MDN7501154.1 hypothetical protein [Burkholderia orbicola]
MQATNATSNSLPARIVLPVAGGDNGRICGNDSELKGVGVNEREAIIYTGWDGVRVREHSARRCGEGGESTSDVRY